MTTAPLIRAVTALWNAALYCRWPRATRDFVRELGHLPDIVLPRTYNEKMFWRRVFDTNPAFSVYCDKVECKSLFEPFRGQLRIPQTLWCGTDPADMPDALMRPDVLVKQTNASTRSCSFSKETPERGEFESQCKAWLKRPFKPWNREWGYLQVQPRLMAEARLAPAETRLTEFKMHVFAGRVYYTVVYIGEKTDFAQSAIFDRDGNRLPVTTTIVVKSPHKALPPAYRLPDTYAAAVEIAERIAEQTDYLRVDFMCAGDELYAGELTPYPTGGLMTNSDPAVLEDMNRHWDLGRSWFMQTDHGPGWRSWYQTILKAHIRSQTGPHQSLACGQSA